MVGVVAMAILSKTNPQSFIIPLRLAKSLKNYDIKQKFIFTKMAYIVDSEGVGGGVELVSGIVNGTLVSGPAHPVVCGWCLL